MLFTADSLPSTSENSSSLIIFHAGQKGIIQYLFSLKLFLLVNVITILVSLPHVFLFSFFPCLVSSDGTTAIQPSAKDELFTQIFTLSFTLIDSGTIPPFQPLSNLGISNTVISFNSIISFLKEMNTKKVGV